MFPTLTKRGSAARLLALAFAAAATVSVAAQPPAAAGAAPAAAAAAAAAAPRVDPQSWARATVPTARVGSVYLVLHGGAAEDRLVSGSTPVAERVELHQTIREGDVMKMREVPALAVPAGGTVRMQPGGLHMMLVGLKRPLNEGERIALTLRFERSGEQRVEISVREAPGHGAAPGAGHGAAHGAGHGAAP